MGVLISEYTALLGKTLVKNVDFEVDREHQNLEALKSRLGSQGFRTCDVMLEDIRRSKVATHLIGRQYEELGVVAEFNVQPYILSTDYWPKMVNEDFELHHELESAFKQYSEVYTKVMSDREITTKGHMMLGYVDIEVNLNERELRRHVTALQASVILHFSEHPRWDLHDMVKVLNAKISSARHAIRYWVSEGFLTSVDEAGLPETYELSKDSGSDPTRGNQGEWAADDGEQELKNQMDDEFYEELWMTVCYIVGRTAQQKKQIDFQGILEATQMYMSDNTVTEEHLSTLLRVKIKENAISLSDHHYYVTKK